MLPMFNWPRGCWFDPILLALTERLLRAFGPGPEGRMGSGTNTRMDRRINPLGTLWRAPIGRGMRSTSKRLPMPVFRRFFSRRRP